MKENNAIASRIPSERYFKTPTTKNMQGKKAQYLDIFGY